MLERIIGSIEDKKHIQTLEFDPIFGMTPLEYEYIKNVSEKEKDILRCLYKPDGLIPLKSIVAFRAEDLFYLIDCIRRGFISTSMFVLTEKVPSLFIGSSVNDTLQEFNGDNLLFTNLNPNSEDLSIKFPDKMDEWFTRGDVNIKFTKGLGNMVITPKIGYRITVENVVGQTQRIYGTIAVKQAIFRNVFPMIEDMEKFMEDVANISVDYNGEPDMEGFFNSLIKPFELMNRFGYEELKVLYENLKKVDFSKNKLVDFIKLARDERKGCIIGFNERILDYKLLAGQGEGGDDVFVIPNQKIPIEAIEAFDIYGECESEVLEMLGV